MVYCGIDPGQTGAIVSLSEDGKLITVSDFEKDDTGRICPLQIKRVIEAIRFYHEEKNYICCLEKSHAMPGQGTVSMFNYGVTYGITLASISLSEANIQIVEITPQSWKKEFDLNSNKKLGIVRTKEDSVTAAINLFPSRENMLRTPKKKGGYVLKHGRAEALLMAEYCRRKYGDNKT